MKYLDPFIGLLGLAVGLVVIIVTERLKHRGALSSDWQKDQRRRAMQAGYEGVSVRGKFHEPIRDRIRWTEKRRA